MVIKPYCGWRIDFHDDKTRDEFIDNCTKEYPFFTDHVKYNLFGIDVRIRTDDEQVVNTIKNAMETAARKEMRK